MTENNTDLLAGPIDLARYFSGAWQLTRRIVDERAGLTGRLIGTARFTPADTDLVYDETGQMLYGAHDGVATQSYRWHLPTPHRAEIQFRDGRLFHVLDLSAGTGSMTGGIRRVTASHDCAPDRYEGRYRLLTANSWSLAWRIEGPRKAMTIVSRYRRA